MKQLFRGVCALLAIVVLMGGQPQNVEADADQTLVIHNSEVTTDEKTIYVGQFNEDGARYFRPTVPIHTVSTDADFIFTAEQYGMKITIDVLTNLNDDNYYEMVNVSERKLTLSTDGRLVSSKDYAPAMKAGERRTLTAAELFGAGYLSARTRALEDTALMNGLEPTVCEEIIYLITADDGHGQSSYYYVRVDENLPSDQKVSDLGAGRFTDIRPWDEYWLDIDWAVRAGVLSGTSTTRFEPDTTVTRAQLVQVLYSQAGDAASNQVTYKDVASNAWYAKAVSWASELGVVSGVGDGKFEPKENVNRQQMSAILMKNATVQGLSVNKSHSLTTYDDCDDVSSWATKSVSWAMATGILVATDDGLLNPKGAVSRAELAETLRVYDGL